ncbi:glycosyl transferase family protein [Alteripontixanthobacter maritimus]|uniref:glycosyl transferase family protein n=1 Tax=Alteripontixanthobacter maritimus TaxID=2161824 RepID=UPI000E1BA40E|nr:glycosyl transferase family protein [Alteripontixanthobacter maritimus]
MGIGTFGAWEWFVLFGHELLFFASVFFLIGAIDEFGVDLAWLWLRLTGRARSPVIDTTDINRRELSGKAAVFIPAWDEAAVIGTTIRHALTVWQHSQLRLYIGCYRNDADTIEAIVAAAAGDPRLRLVIHDRDGPSTKADCLNRLFGALTMDETRWGEQAHMVVLQDAEDMVDPAGLALLDAALGVAAPDTQNKAGLAGGAGLAQLPVIPIPQANSPWIAGHYCEEFAEAHGKAMVVRDALGAGVPAAGVGCGIARPLLDRLQRERSREAHGGVLSSPGPFAAECLTEDYELGLNIAAMGVPTTFVRARTAEGALIGTRACFPGDLTSAVRQKTRWIHGIAFQGWDRLGWSGSAVETWMRLRDRRGPLAALTLCSAYLLLVLSAIGWVLVLAGVGEAPPVPDTVVLLLWVNTASFAWRTAWRFAFAARQYGFGEGIRAVLRIPVANIIAIMAGRRAFAAYLRSLRGHAVRWDKTTHTAHPAAILDAPVGVSAAQ